MITDPIRRRRDELNETAAAAKQAANDFGFAADMVACADRHPDVAVLRIRLARPRCRNTIMVSLGGYLDSFVVVADNEWTPMLPSCTQVETDLIDVDVAATRAWLADHTHTTSTPLILDADVVRDELREAADLYDLTPTEADRLAGLPDWQINQVINDQLDDPLWEAFDMARGDTIRQLARDFNNDEELR